MASEPDMSSWTDLLHSSTKLLEQAAPSAQFPALQLKSETVRTEVPAQSNATTRLLAREGINGEQLVRDLKSFELKKDWQKEKWDFLQVLSRLSTQHRTSSNVGTLITRPGEMASFTYSPRVSIGTTGMESVPLANIKPTLEKTRENKPYHL
ncbi:hypothetical protein MKW92_000467, partial [Papaver armeniacum]